VTIKTTNKKGSNFQVLKNSKYDSSSYEEIKVYNNTDDIYKQANIGAEN